MRWAGSLCVLAVACASNVDTTTPAPPAPPPDVGTLGLAMVGSHATIVVGETTVIRFDLAVHPAHLSVSVAGLPPGITADPAFFPLSGHAFIVLRASADAPLASLEVLLTARATNFLDAAVPFKLDVSALDGSLDPTFGVGGYANVAIADFTPTAIAAAGSKMVIAGNTTSALIVARLNEDGSFDASFGQGGIASSSAHAANAVAVGPDGTVAVSTSAGVATFDASGAIGPTLDNTLVQPLVFSGTTLVGAVQGGIDTFTGSSSAFISLPSNNPTKALALADDGAILVVSATETRRLLPGGAVDPSFDVLAGGNAAAIGPASTTMLTGDSTLVRIASDGTATTTPLDPRLGNGAALVATAQRDGFVRVGFGQVPKTPNAWVALSRFDASGAQALGFGTLGLTTTQNDYSSLYYAGAALDAEGRLWVIGRALAPHPTGVIARYRIAP